MDVALISNIFTNLITRLFAIEPSEQLSITQVVLILLTATFMIFCYKYTASNNSELEKTKEYLTRALENEVKREQVPSYENKAR